MIKIICIIEIINVPSLITASLITHDFIYEMVYLFAKLLELLIHRLGGRRCVVLRISGCSDMFVKIRNSMVSVRRTGTFLVYIMREEAQSFATHDLRCRACLPNSELAVWWTSVSRWFLT